MAWPETRLTTYVAGVSQVKAADLNAMQDEAIDKHAFLNQERTIYIHGAAFHPRSETVDFTKTAEGQLQPHENASVLHRLPLPVGARVKSLVAYITTSANAGSRELQLYQVSAIDASSPSIIGNDTDSTTGTDIVLTITGVPHTVATAKMYQILVDLKDDDILNSVRLVMDDPAT